MFLHFLIASVVAIYVMIGNKRVSYILWAILLAVTLLTFVHHMSSTMTLSF